MSDFSGERAAELREIFFESAREILQAMNEEALRLEQRPDDLEALRGLRRAVHTLKGDAAACGFKDLSHLAHEFEDALVGENLAQSAATVETALTAADVFGEMLEAYHTGKTVPVAKTLRQMIAKLAAPPQENSAKGAAQGKAPLASSNKKADAGSAKKSSAGNADASTTNARANAAPPNRIGKHKKTSAKPGKKNSDAVVENITPKSPWTEGERAAADAARYKSVPVYHLRLELDSHCAMLEAALQIVRNILVKAGEILAFAPADAMVLEKSPVIQALLVTKEAPDKLARKCRVPGIVATIAIDPLPMVETDPARAIELLPEARGVSGEVSSSPAQGQADREQEKENSSSRPEESGRPATPSAATSAENLLRVDAERIDNVLNLVGELIIGRSMFQQTLLEFAKRFPKDPLRTRFADAFAFQSRVLNDLQRSVMKIRMVPVEQLFRRFPRLVRDTARACEKNVQLCMVGQETDLDKGILDSLAEPVAHLVRNAISHGIESPEERLRAGKPEQGTLRLSAYHLGNQMVIEIADDGKGLDTEKIRNKAVLRGLVSAEDALRLGESELLKLIFVPGFSTAEQITEVSGRGVGLDVVQNVLQRLKGSVSVETNPGHGSVFRLRLPLTLAIIKAILFRVEHRLYAVPLNSVAEMTRVHQSEIHLVDGHEVMQLRKEVLTLIRLGRPAGATNDRLFVLVVSHAGQKLGLVVDELSGQEELVIKALDTSILSSDLISGVSILGDGRVVLILNLAAVAERRNHAQNDLAAAPWGMLLPQSEMRKFESGTAAKAGGGA